MASNISVAEGGRLLVMDPTDTLMVSDGGTTATAVAGAKATATVIKATAGRLFRVIVTATGANPMVIYDNATEGSGTIIGALPANPAVGAVYDFQCPAANGITVAGHGTNPGVTITFR